MKHDREALLDQTELQRLLHYEPSTGIFTNRIHRSSTGRAGNETGHLSIKDGYVRITVNNYLYLAHRLAWLYVTGSWPVGRLDHEDRVRHHNWWTNLRPASALENAQNASIRSDNTTGYKGVRIDKRYPNSFFSTIRINGKQKYLGSFKTAELAAAAYQAAAAEHFKQFAGPS